MNRDYLLIVEDSATQAQRLRMLLEDAFPNLEISVAKNGRDAIDSVQDRLPRLIVSDVVMPVMDGYEMCRAIKEDPHTASVPIILLTSLSDPADIVRGLNSGTDYYLTKPYEDDFFLSKVQSVLENPSGLVTENGSGWNVSVEGQQYCVQVDVQQALNLLFSTYESAIQQNKMLQAVQEELRIANEGLEVRVQERTQQLSETNARLSVEVEVRTHAERQLQRQLQWLDGMRQIDAAITGSADLRLTLNVVLEQLFALLHLDAAAILMLAPGSGRLELAAARGLGRRSTRTSRQRDSRDPAHRAARDMATVHIPDIRSNVDYTLPEDVLESGRFHSYMAVPLIAKGHTQAVLEILHCDPFTPDDEWLDGIDAIAGQAAVVIEHGRLFEGLQRSNLELSEAYDSTLEGWSKALDLRDKETEGHSVRVTVLTDLIARKLNLDERQLLHVRRGALLHDIGKLGIPDAILRKPGPLNDEEKAIMQRHPSYAYDMLAPIEFLSPSIDIPYCHHEMWNGMGYPRRLQGPQIPLAARVFAVADVWDALNSDRPYRKAWEPARIREHIRKLSGTHFDPNVVRAFEAVHDEFGPALANIPAKLSLNKLELLGKRQ